MCDKQATERVSKTRCCVSQPNGDTPSWFYSTTQISPSITTSPRSYIPSYARNVVIGEFLQCIFPIISVMKNDSGNTNMNVSPSFISII